MNDQYRAVQRMQAFIEHHYMDDIAWDDCARVSCYSPWHAHRLFKALTHQTPSDYLRRYRLSKSALELRDQSVKVIDVAYRYGYHSVDGYQRAFLREFGVNPNTYAQHPIPLQLFIPYPVFETTPQGEPPVMEPATPFFLTIQERIARCVIVKRGMTADDYWTYCHEVGCDVWGILSSIPSLYGEPVAMWLPAHLVPLGTSRYVQGVEVPLHYEGIVPDGFEIMTLPAATYLMVQGAPYDEVHYEHAIGSLMDAMKTYNPTPLGYRFSTLHPRLQLEPIGTRGYIELYPIEKIDK